MRHVGQHLAGEEQRRIDQAVPFQHQRQWRGVNFVRPLHHHRAQNLVKQIINPLARLVAHDLPGRVNQHKRGPGIGPIQLPHLEILVINHRMGQFIPLNDAPDVVRLPFVLELSRMHPNHHQLVGILLFQPLQVGDDVHAIDTTVSPEIEQHNLAPQVSQGQGLLNVKPIQPGRELRRGHAASISSGHSSLRRQISAAGRWGRRIRPGRGAAHQEQEQSGKNDKTVHKRDS